jgi:flagellar motor switch/type III secretory pathway protein FliN
MAAGVVTARATEKTAGQAGMDALVAIANVDAAKRAESENDETRWQPVLALPCDLMVDLPLPSFTVADLLKLRPGSIANAHWLVGHDIPLRLNGTLIGWAEFEIMGNNLAVRLTELV